MGQAEDQQQRAAASFAATTGTPRDWFLPAIEAEGSVDECLAAVLRDLELKNGFIRALRERMAGSKGRAAGLRTPGPDAVTDLVQRIKALDNTLRFRLGILRPERPAAWFRAPAATTAGPFQSALLDEPVFAHYETYDVTRVRQELSLAWQERRATRLPFRDDAPCLWRTLLTMSAELAALCQMPAPYEDLSLDILPDGLPPSLESRALRAFLMNVRNEIVGARDRLGGCYRELRKKSEELWTAQEREELRGTSRNTAKTNPRADSVREEFKRRRERAADARRFALTTHDRDALRFMGFDDLPSPEDLRRRYIDMAKRLHPDRAGGDDGGFKALSSAYSHLMGRLDGPLF